MSDKLPKKLKKIKDTYDLKVDEYHKSFAVRKTQLVKHNYSEVSLKNVQLLNQISNDIKKMFDVIKLVSKIWVEAKNQGITVVEWTTFQNEILDTLKLLKDEIQPLISNIKVDDFENMFKEKLSFVESNFSSLDEKGESTLTSSSIRNLIEEIKSNSLRINQFFIVLTVNILDTSNLFTLLSLNFDEFWGKTKEDFGAMKELFKGKELELTEKISSFIISLNLLEKVMETDDYIALVPRLRRKDFPSVDVLLKETSVLEELLEKNRDSKFVIKLSNFYAAWLSNYYNSDEKQDSNNLLIHMLDYSIKFDSSRTMFHLAEFAVSLAIKSYSVETFDNITDTIEIYMKSKNALDKLAYYYLRSEQYFRESGDSDSSHNLLKYAVEQLKDVKHEKALGVLSALYSNLVLVQQELHQPDESLESLRKAVELFEKYGDKKETDLHGSLYMNLGMSLRVKQQFIDAINMLRKAEQIFLEEQETFLLSQIYSNLGTCLFQIDKDEESMQCLDKGIKLAEENGRFDIQIEAMFTLAIILRANGDDEAAHSLLAQAMSISQNKANFHFMDNLMHESNKIKPIKQVSLIQRELAHKKGSKKEGVATEVGNLGMAFPKEVQNYIDKGSFFIQMGKWYEAREVYTEMLFFAGTMGLKEAQILAVSKLVEISYKLKDDHSAKTFEKLKREIESQR